MRGLFGRKKQTFQYRKRVHAEGTKMYELHKKALGTLGNGNYRTAVALPDGEDLNEWLAVLTVVRPPSDPETPKITFSIGELQHC